VIVQPQLTSTSPFLVRVAGRRADLARFEVRTVARVLRESGRLLVAEGDSGRLAAVSFVLDYLGAGRHDVLPFCPADVVDGTYAVRVSGTAGRPSLRESLQALVWHGLDDPNVNLSRPDTELHAFVVGDEVWWGKLLRKVTPLDFAHRNVDARPFARSIGIPARIARCLVNLSGIGPGRSLLDPFCGTGSVLIEAALLGSDVYGADIGWPLVRGARLNLAHFGLSGCVERRDATRLGDWRRSFDAIVTDVPYGRSASLHGVAQQSLYRDFLHGASSVLRPGGRAVVMAPKDSLPLPVPGLRLLSSFDEYVHGSLTRTVSVFARP
jgi:putative methyltransferase (TIGR01177 family)